MLTIRRQQIAAIADAEITALQERIASGLLSSTGGPRLDRTADEVRQLVAAGVECALSAGLERRSTVISFVESFVCRATEVVGHQENDSCLETLVHEYGVRELLRTLEAVGTDSSADVGRPASQGDIA